MGHHRKAISIATQLKLGFVSLLVSGCATDPSKITATYTSPIQYSEYSCGQLSEEASRVSARAAQVTGTHKQKADNDAVMMGVGLVLFWPTLFLIGGDGATAAEVARLKGEMEALEQTSIKKNCSIAFNKS